MLLTSITSMNETNFWFSCVAITFMLIYSFSEGSICFTYVKFATILIRNSGNTWTSIKSSIVHHKCIARCVRIREKNVGSSPQGMIIRLLALSFFLYYENKCKISILQMNVPEWRIEREYPNLENIPLTPSSRPMNSLSQILFALKHWRECWLFNIQRVIPEKKWR